MGFVWLLVEPAAVFFGGEIWNRGWGAYIGLVVLSAVLGYVATLPRLPLGRALAGSKVSVRIAVGNLLEQCGNLVIGTNDCFDTDTSGGVISNQSLQGQLLARTYGGDLRRLDQAIEASLKRSKAAGEAAREKSYGKRTRYPMGTTAVLEEGSRRLFLVAYGRMPNSMPARVVVEKADFHHALIALWGHVREQGQREELHLPVLGGNFARFHGTRTQLIQTIVLSFIGAQGPAEVAPTFTIWLLPGDAEKVDLPALAVWLDSVCGR